MSACLASLCSYQDAQEKAVEEYRIWTVKGRVGLGNLALEWWDAGGGGTGSMYEVVGEGGGSNYLLWLCPGVSCF